MAIVPNIGKWKDGYVSKSWISLFGNEKFLITFTGNLVKLSEFLWVPCGTEFVFIYLERTSRQLKVTSWKYFEENNRFIYLLMLILVYLARCETCMDPGPRLWSVVVLPTFQAKEVEGHWQENHRIHQLNCYELKSHARQD